MQISKVLTHYTPFYH